MTHGATEDGEVVAGHGHATTVDPPHARDHAVGGRLPALFGEAGVHVLTQLAVLDEGAVVAEKVEALANGQLALVVLAGDALLASHGQRPLAPRHQVLDGRLPIKELV